VTSISQAEIKIWRLSPTAWASVIGAVALASAFSFDGLKHMVQLWSSREEYSYAYMIPVITLFLIWQRRNTLERLRFDGSWSGMVGILIGFGLFVLGELSTLHIIVQYSFLLILAGLALTFIGWQGFKVLWVPLLLLIFMFPLPTVLYQPLSAQLQLFSSQLGVWIIRLLGISVFLEGNVIDLGSYKLQVAEACDGLRYLFPLMVLGFIAAYFFKGDFWKRVAIFLSTVPITILMNGLRIGVIGILVEYRGPSMAAGFLHDFEGWAVFMVCTGVLVLEMWVLAKIGKVRRSLSEVFCLEFPAPTQNAQIEYRAVPKPFLGAVALLAVVTILSFTLPQPAEVPPQRKEFSDFPLDLGQWRGKKDRIEQLYADALKFDDYILADFLDASQRWVNFYVSYYASQRKGEVTHSPGSCIPAGGWEITSLTQRNIDGATIARQPLRVNRAIIQKGESKQLVYYWFLQRGRVITNEYLFNWYLFWDGLTRNRTDGALVRLTTPVKRGETIEEADEKLITFAKTIIPRLSTYIPE
jgi:exosortase D (VPLPA-CTERM-specific)